MKQFARLMDALSLEPSRDQKLLLLQDYFANTPDPDRGWALEILDGRHKPSIVKPAFLRELITEHIDPILFELSYDYVGDLAETISLLWPQGKPTELPGLSELILLMETWPKQMVRQEMARLLSSAETTERWAILKMATGGLRIGVSGAMLREAFARWSGHERSIIDELWHGLAQPHDNFFAWLEGSGPMPERDRPLMFFSPMLAHPLTEPSKQLGCAADFQAEWKWDGIRAQYHRHGGQWRLYSRTGEDISESFPDLSALPDGSYIIDGELLVLRDDEVGSFGDLQQRLNRKKPSNKLLDQSPAIIMAYDLMLLDGMRCSSQPLHQRRLMLEELVASKQHERLRLSAEVAFGQINQLNELRNNPPHPAMEGLMIKRRDSIYLPGRPKGAWWKWKRDPMEVDAVMLYAQRGHGRRSSLYSDFTFGCWADGQIVPVGKAYFGFTDQELAKLDKFVRTNTINRFGPVREVRHDEDHGLVVTLHFEGIQASPRHKSGIALRFPRIGRIRWDKLPADADGLDHLQSLLQATSR